MTTTAPLSAPSAATANSALLVHNFGPSQRSIALHEGSINVVLGRAGAGKTALCRLIAGLDAAGDARIQLGETDITGVPTRERGVGLVFAQFINYPAWTVRQNIASPLRKSALSQQEREARVAEAAQQTGLSDLLDRLPEELSGGQQQRVAIARALVGEPSVLLLDEPLVNLDFKLRETLQKELRALLHERQITVVYTSSDPREALAVADSLVLLAEGEVIGQGSALSLLRNPGSLQAADLLCDPGINALPAHCDGTTLRIGEALQTHAPEAAELPQGDFMLAARPDHIHLANETSDENDLALSATVQLAELTGSDTYLHLQANELSLIAHLDGPHPAAVGSQVDLRIRVGDLLAFPIHGDHD